MSSGPARSAARNVRLLAEAVRQGYEIVCTEPSAALCLTHEYPDLLDDDDARLVAAHTHEACTYLWQLHEAGKLELNFQPLNLTLGYHLPCHLRALEVGSPGENLLRLIQGVNVRRIERGCSGMAGTFGLKRENYRASLRAGWGLIRAMRDPAIQFGTTECSACKMQMEQGTTKPTIHPLKILALAYGVMPEIESLLVGPQRGADGHMKVRVKLFAVARQRVGQRQRIEVRAARPDATVRQLRGALVEQFPAAGRRRAALRGSPSTASTPPTHAPFRRTPKSPSFRPSAAADRIADS